MSGSSRDGIPAEAGAPLPHAALHFWPPASAAAGAPAVKPRRPCALGSPVPPRASPAASPEGATVRPVQDRGTLRVCLRPAEGGDEESLGVVKGLPAAQCMLGHHQEQQGEGRPRRRPIKDAIKEGPSPKDGQPPGGAAPSSPSSAPEAGLSREEAKRQVKGRSSGAAPRVRAS